MQVQPVPLVQVISIKIVSIMMVMIVRQLDLKPEHALSSQQFILKSAVNKINGFDFKCI